MSVPGCPCTAGGRLHRWRAKRWRKLRWTQVLMESGSRWTAAQGTEHPLLKPLDSGPDRNVQPSKVLPTHSRHRLRRGWGGLPLSGLTRGASRQSAKPKVAPEGERTPGKSCSGSRPPWRGLVYPLRRQPTHPWTHPMCRRGRRARQHNFHLASNPPRPLRAEPTTTHHLPFPFPRAREHPAPPPPISRSRPSSQRAFVETFGAPATVELTRGFHTEPSARP